MVRNGFRNHPEYVEVARALCAQEEGEIGYSSPAAGRQIALQTTDQFGVDAKEVPWEASHFAGIDVTFRPSVEGTGDSPFGKCMGR